MEKLKLTLFYVGIWVVFAAIAWVLRFFLTLAGMIVLYLFAFIHYTFTFKFPDIDPFTPFQCWIAYLIISGIVFFLIFSDEYKMECAKLDGKLAEKRKIKKQKQLTKAMMKVDYSGALRHLPASDHGKFKTLFLKIQNRVIKNEKYNSMTAEQAFDYMKKVVWQWCKERGYSNEVIQNILIDTKILDK